MRVVVQRVSEASCMVEETITGEIGKGFLLLVGFGLEDNEEIAAKMAQKVSKLRIFEDENGKMNLSLFDVGGDILSISQFTLYGDAKKGNRPSFTAALGGEKANMLYEHFNEELRKCGLRVETGIFGADMKIRLLNDGPVTILLESEEKK